MPAFVIVLIFLTVTATGILLTRMIITSRNQEELVRKVRKTRLYGNIYPFLKKYDSEYVETVVFRPEYISIRTMVPYGGENKFTFSRHGMDNPTQDTLFALAQAATCDMHVLRGNGGYTFRTHSGISPNGTRYNWYAYTMKSSYKDEIIRSEARKRAENGPLVQEQTKIM